MKEETLESKVIYKGKILTLKVDKVRLPNGKTTEREIVERRNGVSILPITKERYCLLIRQYRHAAGEIAWRLPGGGIEKDELPADTASRELFEELGYRAKHLDLLYKSGGSGAIRQVVYHFLATELYKPDEVQRQDEEEFLELHPTRLEDAARMAKSGAFANPAFAMSIIMAEERLKNR